MIQFGAWFGRSSLSADCHAFYFLSHIESILSFLMCRFGKQIRYASRKARADTRKRVKGRFVKAGEAYDYDPLVTGSY